MNNPEILAALMEALNLPIPCDFLTLHEVCRDPDIFRMVLSHALIQGEKKGMVDTHGQYHDLLGGRRKFR